MGDGLKKLTPPSKPEPAQVGTTIQMNPPTVKVGAPQVTVKVPEIKIPAINMGAPDMTAIAGSIRELASVVGALMTQNSDLISAVNDQNARIEKLVNREITAPHVTMPKRPGGYDVELVKDADGDTVGMRIDAIATH